MERNMEYEVLAFKQQTKLVRGLTTRF